MQSFFKSEKFTIEGVVVTIRELSAADHRSIFGKPPEDVAPLLCKACVTEWGGETVDAIIENVPVRVMREISAAIFRLSGIDEAKNSEPTPSAGSSSV